MYQSRSSQSVILIESGDHEFKVPQRAVKTPMDMQLWERSEAYSEFLGFILALNETIKGKPLSVSCHVSNTVTQNVVLLEKLDKLIDDIKPIQQPQRFGNQAFRHWYNAMKDKSLEYMQQALPERFHRAIPEIGVYFTEGFGNSTRIDYGTGHEISYLMYLCCLFKIGAFTDVDNLAVVTRIFPKYLYIVRKLQQTYRMEPAGSHGVWSLDDYQFVPFIWGSSQLIANPDIDPSSFLKEEILTKYARDYLFLGCIEYINQVKTGLFAEHSNQLWGISGVSHWSKVNSGLIKMYKVEVLGKFPVIQHIVFGSLLPFRPTPPELVRTPLLSLSSVSSLAQSSTTGVSNNHEYVIPKRAVLAPEDMPLWENSQAYADYYDFILSINEIVKEQPLSVSCRITDNVVQHMALLDKLDKLVDKIKPFEQPQRYGNQAFRVWYNTLKEKGPEMLMESLPSRYHKAVKEILPYLYDGFGNSTRIDYGTGHEISYLMFLCCCFKIGVFEEEDKLAVATRIFPRYLNLVRKLQQVYRMEPAGSRGVWCLDDHQFVPFIWGSSQLIDHPLILPSSFLNENLLTMYGRDYMFLGCIQYINFVKKGPFAEHSNQLWGISSISHWGNVNTGLLKMYKAEVLGKFPVVQHIVFGSLLRFEPVRPASG